MHKLRMSIIKEMLLLRRDPGALLVLFVMPLLLIITITLIQDGTFKTLSDTKIPILLIDNDHGNVSSIINKNLGEAGAFEVRSAIDGVTLTEQSAEQLVRRGEYQLAIIIPARLSADLQAKVDQNVSKITAGFGIADTAASVPEKTIAPKEIRIYFDPAAQSSFRNAVKNSVDKMISGIETASIYKAFEEELGEDEFSFDTQSFVTFSEISPIKNGREIMPNSTQHNVPAWTLFAIFFIVIPLSINIVREKNQGTLVRLRTNPVSYPTVIAAKTITFLMICMLQFYLMVIVGVYLFPHLNLPSLETEGILGMMSLVAVCSGFAAIGFGILLGTLAKTPEQSAPMGATSVVILAAVGGVWVPVFAMPKIMQLIAGISPMNWGLNAFYDVILRDATLIEILPELGLLLLFFLAMVAISLFYDNKERAV